MVLRKGASNLEMNLDQFTDFADSWEENIKETIRLEKTEIKR